MAKKLVFEDAMNRLEEITKILTEGETSLEKSLELYSESGKLVAFCSKALEEAQLTVEELFPEASLQAEVDNEPI